MREKEKERKEEKQKLQKISSILVLYSIQGWKLELAVRQMQV